ncbi:MAG: alginate export family protein [Candidatus Omnitrophica bacterium]|nr:alginate export family protein [Candidatus Omnitrophota bacterium]
MRKLIILAIALMVALVAVPAFASVQNVKVSGDIDSTWLYRNNFDFGSSTSGGGANPTVENIHQSIFMTQTRLRVDADLTDQVSATVALINERAWGNDNEDAATTKGTTVTDIDLNLAYVTLREMLYSPLTVVVGRQVFSYGNSLIVNASGTNNAASSDSGIAAVAGDLSKQAAMDAIRLIFDYNPLTLEVLYAKINENTATSAVDHDTDDIDLYGINATYELGDDLNTQVEGYFFARINKSTNDGTAAATNGTKSDTTYVPGLRASADVLDGLNIQGEVAWQRGNNVSSTSDLDNEKRDAFAAQFVSNYQIPKDVLPDALDEYSPALGYTYTYVSGDSNPADSGYVNQASANIDTAWDPMFEAQGGKTIYNALFNLTNLQIHSVSLTANPMEDVTAKVTWNGLWLDKKIDPSSTVASTFALQRPDAAATYTPTADKDETGLGYEIDVDAIYDYTEDVQLGASFGWFVPGDVFEENHDSVASQAIVHGIVNF